MKTLFTTLLILLSINISYSENISFDINIENNAGQSFELLKAGVSDTASNGVDWNMEEDQFPCGGIPGNVLHASFRIESDCSYIDFRELYADSAKVMHTYQMLVDWGKGTEIYFTAGELPFDVDSVVVYDDYNQNIRFGRLTSEDTIIVKNDVFERFLVKVWYNNPGTDIIEKPDYNLNVYPNPFKESIFIKSDDIKYYRLLDVNGVTLKQENLTNGINTLKAENLSTGIYFLELTDIFGDKIIKKLIKY